MYRTYASMVLYLRETKVKRESVREDGSEREEIEEEYKERK